MSNKRNRNTPKGPPGGFAGIPRIVMESEDFKGLSSSAKVILMVLAYQYRGSNNGDLTAAPAYLRNWGIRSKVTAQRASAELLEARLIVRTRDPIFLNPGGRCALYALTWQPIDECNGKLEVTSTTTPPRKFSRNQAS
jgi:hypothetical protein